MNFWQASLYPLTLLYTGLSNFRNHLYNIGYKKSFAFDTKVISVGNLTVGGTGKTPHIEYLICLLKDEYSVATLSRGYGRRTKGFIIAEQQSTAQEIGDEPMQFYRKFASEISVAVGEERALAIPQILFERPKTQVILLDDAYQHRPVRPNLNILITDYRRLFYRDYPFPSGRLRESRKGAKRADIIIVSKCPDDLGPCAQAQIKKNLSRYTSQEAPIFFTGIRYAHPQPVAISSSLQDTRFLYGREVLLFSGIAQAQGLIQYVAEHFYLSEHIKFKDHHSYTPRDLSLIRHKFRALHSDKALILCTEKDAVKLLPAHFQNLLKDLPVYYLPIEVFFLKEKKTFNELIWKEVRQNQAIKKEQG